jgi:hypothetical protein
VKQAWAHEIWDKGCNNTRQPAEIKNSIRKLSECMDRKLDMSITVVHKKIYCIKARLEAKATALEGRTKREKWKLAMIET